MLEQLVDASWLRRTPDGDYAFQPLVPELLAVLDDSQAHEEMLPVSILT
jgi:hypothetical protein